MNVLITGGAGYLGTTLVPYLIEKGINVTVIDNFMYGQAPFMDLCKNSQFDIVNGDARDGDLLKEHLNKKDFIIPLACLTGAPLCDKNKHDAHSVNLEAIETLIKLKDQSQRIVFPTTNSGYGIGEKDKHCDENSPLRPVSLYGKLKVEAESKILDTGNAVTFRLATVFGPSPRMRLDLMVNDFVYRAFFDKSLTLFESHFRRNFLYVGDVARAFHFAIENFDSIKNEPYNVGLNEANLTKKELCEKIKNYIPSFQFVENAIAKDPDQRDYLVSNDKINGKGFEAKTDLDEGIKQLLKAYTIIKEKQFRNI